MACGLQTADDGQVGCHLQAFELDEIEGMFGEQCSQFRGKNWRVEAALHVWLVGEQQIAQAGLYRALGWGRGVRARAKPIQGRAAEREQVFFGEREQMHFVACGVNRPHQAIGTQRAASMGRVRELGGEEQNPHASLSRVG